MRQMYQTLGKAFAIYHIEKTVNPFRQYEFIDRESGHMISGDAETAMRLIQAWNKERNDMTNIYPTDENDVEAWALAEVAETSESLKQYLGLSA